MRFAVPGKGMGILAVLALLVLPSAATGRDSRPVAAHQRSIEAMGGREAFDAHRMVKFSFRVARNDEELSNWVHVWDRHTGRYRLEGKTREDEDLLVLMNVNDRSGEVWLAGAKLDPEAAASHLENAYGRFINDTYWLLMPWKWNDPGVQLVDNGEQDRNGKVYDTVRLSFDQVGLTSNDVYFGFVSKETGLMERWEYVLQTQNGEPGDTEPTAWTWEDWVEVGDGLRICRTKRMIRNDDLRITITHPLAEFSKEVDPEVFDPPSGGNDMR